MNDPQPHIHRLIKSIPIKSNPKLLYVDSSNTCLLGWAQKFVLLNTWSLNFQSKNVVPFIWDRSPISNIKSRASSLLQENSWDSLSDFGNSKMLKTSSDKVQMCEGVGEKQERIVFSVHWWTSNLGAGIYEVLTAKNAKPTAASQSWVRYQSLGTTISHAAMEQ
jgi:hypothetical protein